MKSGIYYSLIFSLLLATASCKKFDDFQEDPNRTTQATPNLLLSTAQQQAFNQITLGSALATRQLVNVESVSSEQYYGWLRGSYTPYDQLRQVLKLQQEAERTGEVSYQPLALFFKSWHLYQLTMTFGDIPASAALQGDADNFSPVYDEQKNVFLMILNDLQHANELIGEGTASVSGDLIYGGNMLSWKKLINSFSLRVLMTLSSKESDAELNIRGRLREIVSNPAVYPLMTGNADNGALPYYDAVNNRYPYFNNNGIQTAIYFDRSFVNLLQEFEDPRLFSIARPAPALQQQYGSSDFRAYAGVDGSASNNVNASQVVAGMVSPIQTRFFHDPVNEPAVGMGYAEQEFILAEAVLRGWINGDALQYYHNGIRASLQFSNVDAAAAEAYVTQPSIVRFSPGLELEAVITQKYIATFMQPGWQGFYENRRTGFPEFKVDGGAVLNGGAVPKRWMYPENEFNTNREQVEAAINRQFPEGDNVNGLMWLLK